MILNSNATRNEDRFNAILPSWNKYNHVIKNKNTISDWIITDMTLVRLKLYEIMDDLWDKATLPHACKEGFIWPTFASRYLECYLKLDEKADYNSDVYKQFEKELLRSINYKNEQESIKIKQLMDEYKMNFKLIWNENLTNILFEPRHCYLSVKSNSYFITYAKLVYVEYYQNILPLDNDDDIHQVMIPFFTSNLPSYIGYLPIYINGSKIFLIGNKKKNKWLLLNHDFLSYFKPGNLCTDNYTFNIY